MGYRSHVYIKVDREHEEALSTLLKDNDILDYMETVADEDYYYVYGEWLKWYEGYEDVDAINSFISDCDDGSKGLIAIGEDNAVTEIGQPWDLDMYVVNYISEFPLGRGQQYD